MTVVYTSETPSLKRKERNAREVLNKMAAKRGWEVTTGIKPCGHHWSIYQRGPWTMRVDWTFSEHVRYATLRSADNPRFQEDAPSYDRPDKSQMARFAWCGDKLYSLGEQR